MDLKSFTSDDDEAKAVDAVAKFYSNPEEILTKEEFRTLAEKYTSLWNDCISDVQQEKGEEVTVGNYSNKYTVLTINMSEEFLESTAEKYINTIKEDETIKDIFITRLGVCDEETYIRNLDDAVESIKADDGDDVNLTFKTYVDATGKVRGYTLKDENDDGFEYLFTGENEQTVNGIINFTDSENSTYFKCNVDYVENDGKYTGSADMTFTENDEDEKVVAEFTDLQKVNDEYGYVNGNINLSVNDSAPFAIVLDSDGSSQKANFDIDIEDINYGNVTLEIISSEISELNIPDKSGAYIVDKNTNDLEGYVSEENIINFMSSVVKNIGFAETDEEARSIVNSYLYGYSTSYSDYNGLIY